LEEGRWTILDELAVAGVPERTARKLAAVIRRSRRMFVTAELEEGELALIIRGVVEENPGVEGEELDGTIVKAGRGYVAVFWREGERRWGYVIVAGACNAHRGVGPQEPQLA